MSRPSDKGATRVEVRRTWRPATDALRDATQYETQNKTGRLHEPDGVTAIPKGASTDGLAMTDETETQVDVMTVQSTYVRATR